MTMWMVWTIGVSMLIAIAAALVARVAALVGAPRRFVWTFAIVLSSIGPLLLPARSMTLPWRSATRASLTDRVLPQRANTPVEGAAHAMYTTQSRNWNAVAQRVDSWSALAWALWSAILFVSFVRAIIELRRRRRSWTQTYSEVGQIFVAAGDGPAVVGWMHPRIVIPSWTLGADASTRELILRHEHEHLRVGDTRLLLISDLLRRALPWNIALWWMADQLRLAVELDCDARVLRRSGTAHSYGVMLLEVSERIGRALPLAASTLALRSDLERRLSELGAERLRRPIAASIPYAVLAMIVVTTAAWTPRPGFPLHVRTTIAPDSDLIRVGYVHRKETVAGVFMDSAQIDHGAPLFSDVFRAVKGLSVAPSGDGHTNVITGSNAGVISPLTGQPAKAESRCAQVFVDGTAWQASSPGDVDNFINPAQLIAAEVYDAANSPPQFARASDGQCASIVVWTQQLRRRRR